MKISNSRNHCTSVFYGCVFDIEHDEPFNWHTLDIIMIMFDENLD